MSKNEASGDPVFLKQQSARLVDMRDQLLGREAARTTATRPEDTAENEDDAQRLAQIDIDDALGGVEGQRLRLIERALAKIDEGTYGLSDESGAPIPKARLEVSPEATLTIEEEMAREQRQRR